MEGSMLAMVLQSLVGLSLVLALFAFVIWGVRRFQQHNGSAVNRDFKIIARLHLDNKNSLVEVRHQGRHYLLGLSPGGMVQLHSDHGLHIDAPSTPAENHE